MSGNGNETHRPRFLEWYLEALEAAAKRQGRPIDSTRSYKQRMLESGFEDIVEETVAVDTGKHGFRSAALRLLDGIGWGLEGRCLDPLSSTTGMSKAQIELICTHVRAELEHPETRVLLEM